MPAPVAIGIAVGRVALRLGARGIRLGARTPGARRAHQIATRNSTAYRKFSQTRAYRLGSKGSGLSNKYGLYKRFRKRKKRVPHRYRRRR